MQKYLQLRNFNLSIGFFLFAGSFCGGLQQIVFLKAKTRIRARIEMCLRHQFSSFFRYAQWYSRLVFRHFLRVRPNFIVRTSIMQHEMFGKRTMLLGSSRCEITTMQRRKAKLNLGFRLCNKSKRLRSRLFALASSASALPLLLWLWWWSSPREGPETLAEAEALVLSCPLAMGTRDPGQLWERGFGGRRAVWQKRLGHERVVQVIQKCDRQGS